MTTEQLVSLPDVSEFEDVEVPEFNRKYTKRQGAASVKKNPKGRTFSASGPKADLIAKMIFSDYQLTRRQMADIANCSPSRVSEVIWALEDAFEKGQIEGFPQVPTRSPIAEDEVEETEETEERKPSELNEDITELLEAE